MSLSFDVLIVLEEGPLCAGGSKPLFDSTFGHWKDKGIIITGPVTISRIP